MKTTEQIRRELKKLILKNKKTCTTQQEKNNAVNDARQEINAKYGKGWREQLSTIEVIKFSSEPSIYDGHTNGIHWMD